MRKAVQLAVDPAAVAQRTYGDDAKLAAMADTHRQVDEDASFLVMGFYPEHVAMQRNLHCVQGSSGTMLLFGDAWKG